MCIRDSSYGIQAIESLKDQLAAEYSARNVAKSDAELWAMVGTTPMIGLNDVTSESFEISDAQQTLDFVQEHAVGRIGTWSLNRDHPCGSETVVRVDCSSTASQTSDWQFSLVFDGMTP